MSETILLTILGVSCISMLLILLYSIRKMNKHLYNLEYYMCDVYNVIKQNQHIDKNLEGFKIGSLKYILIGTRLYITAIMEQSVAEERFEDAARCKNAINEISKLINF